MINDIEKQNNPVVFCAQIYDERFFIHYSDLLTTDEAVLKDSLYHFEEAFWYSNACSDNFFCVAVKFKEEKDKIFLIDYLSKILRKHLYMSTVNFTILSSEINTIDLDSVKEYFFLGREEYPTKDFKFKIVPKFHFESVLKNYFKSKRLKIQEQINFLKIKEIEINTTFNLN